MTAGLGGASSAPPKHTLSSGQFLAVSALATVGLLLTVPPLGYLALVVVAATSWRFPALGSWRLALTGLAVLVLAALALGWGVAADGSQTVHGPRPAANPPP